MENSTHTSSASPWIFECNVNHHADFPVTNYSYTYGNRSSTGADDRTTRTRGFAKIKIGDLEANLPPLPNAEKEAIQIAKLFNTEALTGNKATKAVVIQKMQRSTA